MKSAALYGRFQVQTEISPKASERRETAHFQINIFFYLLQFCNYLSALLDSEPFLNLETVDCYFSTARGKLKKSTYPLYYYFLFHLLLVVYSYIEYCFQNEPIISREWQIQTGEKFAFR